MKAFACVVAGTVFFLSGCAHQQNVALNPNSGPKAAVVQGVNGGEANLIGAGESRPARRGTVIEEGDTLQTSSRTQAEVWLGERGPVVRLEPDTSVRFTRSIDDPSMLELDLTQGRITRTSLATKEETRYQVRTARGIMLTPTSPTAEESKELKKFKREAKAIEAKAMLKQ